MRAVEAMAGSTAFVFLLAFLDDACEHWKCRDAHGDADKEARNQMEACWVPKRRAGGEIAAPRAKGRAMLPMVIARDAPRFWRAAVRSSSAPMRKRKSTMPMLLTTSSGCSGESGKTNAEREGRGVLRLSVQGGGRCDFADHARLR